MILRKNDVITLSHLGYQLARAHHDTVAISALYGRITRRDPDDWYAVEWKMPDSTTIRSEMIYHIEELQLSAVGLVEG